ncbi:hypothetical protein C8Q73DRAFT_474431 [Cubamyces lactineus]|nr:hypothetical protein C8Q73DRAFT_474431 [Cubamyces lactineus]
MLSMCRSLGWPLMISSSRAPPWQLACKRVSPSRAFDFLISLPCLCANALHGATGITKALPWLYSDDRRMMSLRRY